MSAGAWFVCLFLYSVSGRLFDKSRNTVLCHDFFIFSIHFIKKAYRKPDTIPLSRVVRLYDEVSHFQSKRNETRGLIAQKIIPKERAWIIIFFMVAFMSVFVSI